MKQFRNPITQRVCWAWSLALDTLGTFLSPIGPSSHQGIQPPLLILTLPRVLVFQTNGVYLREIGSPGQFHRPLALHIDDTNDRLIVTDKHRVQVFTASTGQ